MFKLLISFKARKEIKEMSKTNREAILSALSDIREVPNIGKPLTRGQTGRFSYRVGVNRIIYKVNAKDKVVMVLTAGHRSVVYN